MRWFASLPLFFALGCDAPAPLASDPQPPPSDKPVVDRKALAAKLEPWLTREEEAPKHFAERRCPDDVVARPSELILRVEDARWEKKSLIPLRVTKHLTWPDASALEQVIVREHGELEPSVVPQVETLAAARYVGVFHVIQFSQPRRIFRPNKIKPEWVPGIMTAWFAVHEAKGGPPVCGTHMMVKNDVSQAPLMLKLREETAEALTEALGRELRAKAPAALGKMSQLLSMPNTNRQESVAKL
jgi:hypothetical protein